MIGLLYLPAGCISKIVPIKDYAPGQIGKNIFIFIEEDKHGAESAYKLWGWRDKKVIISNERWEYVTMVARSCWIHWIVNKEDIIVDYRTEGNCR